MGFQWTNTSNRRQFDIDITSIHQKENIDKFQRLFDELIRCNFDSQKFDGVSTCFVRRNFDGQKIYYISIYVLQRNFVGRKFHIVSMYFFDAILMNEKSRPLRRAYFDVFLKDKLWWSFWHVFLINFRFNKNENSSKHLH